MAHPAGGSCPERRPALRVYYEALVSEFDVGRYSALLRADAVLSIDSNPPGAVVIAQLYAEKDRVLVPMEPRILGAMRLCGFPHGGRCRARGAAARYEGSARGDAPVHIP